MKNNLNEDGVQELQDMVEESKAERKFQAEVKFAQEYPRVAKVRRVIARLFNF